MSELNIYQDCTKEDLKKIDDGIVQWNFEKLYTDQEPLVDDVNLALRNENGEICGGLVSYIYYYILEIQLLWVDKDYHYMGYGTKLLKEAEEIAKDKGCTMVKLDTFDFQAPNFYKKHGYEVFGVLDNSPKGHKRFFLKKELN